MKEIRFIENDEIGYRSLEDVHDYLRDKLGINRTVYGYFPSDMDEISVSNSGEGKIKVFIEARGKLFELDVENKTYTPVKTDLK